MNTSSLSRIITGLVVLAFGAAALLGAVGVFDFGSIIWRWWPLLVIIGGGIVFINDRRQIIWALLMVFAGVLFQLQQLDLINFNVWQLFWPVVIIGIGLSIILNRTGNKTRSSDKNVTTLGVALSGSDIKNHSEDYKGGELSAIMGGIQLDLRDAKIKKSATLNVFVLFGGVEIKVPKGWSVQVNATPIMGGVDGKALESPKAGAPTLIITGNVMLGGVEIKH